MSIPLRDPPRVVFVAVILIGHAAALQVLMSRMDIRRGDVPPEFRAEPIHIVLLPLAPSPAREEQTSRSASEQPPARAPRATSPPPDTSTAITLPSPDPADPRPLTDWSAESERFAREWAARDPGSAESTESATVRGAPERPERNIFEGNSPRRAGYVEMLDQGVERRWISPRCYWEFGGPPDLVGRTRRNVNTVTCLPGPGPVRDDLFDHLKPEYLKDEE